MQTSRFARRSIVALALGSLGAALVPLAAHAQGSYPERIVTIVVPFGPGGSADVYARVLAEKLGRWRDDGVREARFLIGAADGFDDAQRAGADLLLSFGRATWPHMMARAMLAEQLWRATSILANHPYHREG